MQVATTSTRLPANGFLAGAVTSTCKIGLPVPSSRLSRYWNPSWLVTISRVGHESSGQALRSRLFNGFVVCQCGSSGFQNCRYARYQGNNRLTALNPCARCTMMFWSLSFNKIIGFTGTIRHTSRCRISVISGKLREGYAFPAMSRCSSVMFSSAAISCDFLKRTRACIP